MVVIMKNYSTTFFISIYLLITPLNNVFAEPISSPELGDPYSEVLPLKQEKIIGFSTYRRLQKYNMINNNPYGKEKIKIKRTNIFISYSL